MALIAASARGHLSIVTLLIDNGANIHGHNRACSMLNDLKHTPSVRFNETAIIAAAGIQPPGYDEIVRLLVSKGAARGSARPMLKALEERSPEMILCLLDNGVDFDHSKKEREWAFTIAVAEDHKRLIDVTLGMNVNIHNAPIIWGCRTPLQCVAARGNGWLVRHFIGLGANVNHRGSVMDWGGNCALMAAAACGHASVVRILLDHGARIEGARCHLGNVLQTICFLGHAEVLQTLLEIQPAGLNWDVKTPMGADLISLAAQPLMLPWKSKSERAGNEKVVKILRTSVPMFRQRYASRISALSST